MKSSRIGHHKVSAIGQGTYGFGGKLSRESTNAGPLIESLRLGFELGMTLVDTAEIYAGGESEVIVGKAMEGFKREKLFVATKVWMTFLSYEGFLNACNQSLSRLKTNYIDLYQIHWPNPATPIYETMKAFERLMSKGLIKNIGVSNFSVQQMKEAQEALSKNEIVSNQLPYSLSDRSIESDILPYCKENKIAVIAYSPLKYVNMTSGKTAELLGRISRKHKRTPAQVAINWLVSKGTIPIPKAANKQHIEENSAAADFSLTKQEMSELGDY